MNPQPLSDHQDSSRVELGEGVGRRLRAARLDLGLDLERVAVALHLRPDLVEALEVGRYEHLPAPVFITGYIRNYARQVGLDPEPLIAAYRSAQGQPEPARAWTQPRATDRDRGGSGLLVRLMTAAVIAGLAYLFAQWWQTRAPSVAELVGEAPASGSDPAAPGPAGGAADRPALAGEEPPGVGGRTPSLAPGAESAAGRAGALLHQVQAAVAEDAEAGTQGALSASSAPTGEAPVGPAAAAPEPAVAAGAAAQAAQDQGDVVLEFRGPCWVDVRDSAKSFSLTGEMVKGDRRVLGGTPPYSLILGNASSVAVTVKGAPFDLARIAKGNVARFKLDPAKLP